MPRLWRKTIEAHRREVRDALLDSAEALARKDGLSAVTMVNIASHAGVGRATLYKYFSDVQAVLRAWHERSVESHLRQLHEAAATGGSLRERVTRLLQTYTRIVHAEHGSALVALLRDGEASSRGFAELERILSSALREGVKAGEVRADIPVHELALYARHALSGAHLLTSAAAVQRLVALTTASLWAPAGENKKAPGLPEA